MKKIILLTILSVLGFSQYASTQLDQFQSSNPKMYNPDGYHVVVTLDFGTVSKHEIDLINQRMTRFRCEADVRLNVSFANTEEVYCPN